MSSPRPSGNAVPHHRVVIVGTGFSGLGMAIRLSERGEQDYVVLEKASDLGGTWRDNTYPGCACDVPSRLYSFSFRPKPDWSRDFASADEIWAYLRECAEHYGVTEKITFGADLAEAAYDEDTHRWDLTARDGRRWTADALVLGVGALHEPRRPDVPGLDSFGGPVMHTAQWPEQDELDGRRVAVIGTGASTVQLVPTLAPRTEHLTVFQRSPAWILPKHDDDWSQRRIRTFTRFPVVQRLVRWRTYWELESRVVAFARFPAAMKIVEGVARRHLDAAGLDPQTQAQLTPDYTIGCKRILLSNDYWPSFRRDDVSLVTSAVARVEPGVVIAADGTRHEVDALVLGTGFDVAGSFSRMEIRGLGGRTARQAWSGGLATDLGITVAGFPELYLLLGPNTGLGHNSVIVMIEMATSYVLKCLDRAKAGAQVLTQQAQDDFTAEMRRRSKRTVWASGCTSWYLDRFGHNTTVWPGSTLSYWWRTRRVDRRSFRPVPRQPQEIPCLARTSTPRSASLPEARPGSGEPSRPS